MWDGLLTQHIKGNKIHLAELQDDGEDSNGSEDQDDGEVGTTGISRERQLKFLGIDSILQQENGLRESPVPLNEFIFGAGRFQHSYHFRTCDREDCMMNRMPKIEGAAAYQMPAPATGGKSAHPSQKPFA
ncbi:hypothetical protein OCU04_011275 [Sclerotinia nivalis]|uniref:Uncharacterized protein n=1 Tax=Sclerotinia nivalis TaxID=352851 RepID=A0A9X0ABE4_9HELO|nr:hypothetical protein OCU04_011275 [Sclerotinia nivalis]